MEEWLPYETFKDCYACHKKFNGWLYYVIIDIEYTGKSARFWVQATSGKKRSELTEPDLHRSRKSEGV